VRRCDRVTGVLDADVARAAAAVGAV